MYFWQFLYNNGKGVIFCKIHCRKGGADMHLKDGVNINDFLTDIENCDAEVYFETPEGDSLSLNSVLSQCVFSTIAKNSRQLKQGTFRLVNPADMKWLDMYLEDPIAK